MTDVVLPLTVDEWHQAIASKASSTAEVVAGTLEELGIRPQPVLPRARTLNVESIKIVGVKQVKGVESSFSFEWSSLQEGLWALYSQGNSKGKTSILSTIRASLQGRFPGRIKRDVWSWISFVEVGFAVDSVPYVVSLKKQPGEVDEANASAALLRCSNDQSVCLYSGPAGEGLSGALEDVFMDELGFDRFHAYKSAQGLIVEHGWPAMSSALFISGPGPAIFGDHLEDGLPIRLIQMFIGLPWVSTYTAVSSALKRAKNLQERATETAQTETAKVAARVAELQAQHEEKNRELSGLPDRRKLRFELDKLDCELARAQAEVTLKRNELEVARERAQESTASHIQSRRLLQQAKDEAAAGYVFRRLKPVCCPACEGGLEPGRFDVEAVETCGLCGSSDLPLELASAADFCEMEAAVRDSEATKKEALAGVNKAEKALRCAEESRTGCLLELQQAEKALSSADRSETLLREIAVIEARLEELNVFSAGEKTMEPESEIPRILKVAEKITKEMMESMQAEIMSEVEAQVFGLAERFGVRNLESISFKAHRMDLRQGGVDLTFGGLNAGENLRMRIATALAALKVARSRGFGRHPGLLILDSPAASEMSTEDFTALIGAVGATVMEIPGVQVIVGAVMRPELDQIVAKDHRKGVMGSEGLF